jgi:hypothetical protein
MNIHRPEAQEVSLKISIKKNYKLWVAQVFPQDKQPNPWSKESPIVTISLTISVMNGPWEILKKATPCLRRHLGHLNFSVSSFVGVFAWSFK